VTTMATAGDPRAVRALALATSIGHLSIDDATTTDLQCRIDKLIACIRALLDVIAEACDG
jgi:hypothetical protein